MKKLLLVLIPWFGIGACVSVQKKTKIERRLYLGVNSSGYLTANDALFTGPKEWLFDIKNIKIYTPLFLLPDDIVFIFESQIYNYRPTNGVMIYKQEKKSRRWAKVFFIPPGYVVGDIVCGETIKILVNRKNKTPITLSFKWIEEKPNFSARWVRT